MTFNNTRGNVNALAVFGNGASSAFIGVSYARKQQSTGAHPSAPRFVSSVLPSLNDVSPSTTLTNASPLHATTQ